ncbi:PAS domain S-box protein [Chitinimonas lacunae]|uniref:histidine kinase n=1 Tax=Chitinimonas lacunae TaxID=1963018 RepID=A0ABV8MPR5_9NEIS
MAGQLRLAWKVPATRRLTLLYVCLSVVAAALTAYAAYALRSQILHQTERELGNLSYVLTGQTRNTVQSVDLLLQATIERLSEDQQLRREWTSPALYDHFRQRIVGVPQVRELLLADRNGRVIGHSLTATPQNSIGDRPFFQIHVADRSADMRVGEPVRGRTDGKWGVALSRRVETPDGQFNGVLVAVFDPIYLLDLYRSIELGHGSAVSLMRADGILLTRWPIDESWIGHSFGNSPVFRELLSRQNAGVITGKSSIDGERRITYSQRLDRYPFVVNVSINEAVALAEWHRQMWMVIVGVGFTLLALGLLTVALIRQELRRAEVEQAVLANEARLRAIDEASPLGIFLADAQGDCIHVNSSYLQMAAVPMDKLLGKGWLERIDPEDRATVAREWYAAAERHQNFSLEFRYRRPDGQSLWVNCKAAVIVQRGQVAGFVGTVEDITERRAAEAKQRETFALQRAVLDGTHYAIISTDTDGVIRSFNRGAEKMLGYHAEEVVGRVTPLLIHDLQEIASQAEQLSAELGCTIKPSFDVFAWRTRDGAVDEREWTYVCRDGRRLPVMVSTSALRDEKGTIQGYLSVAHDLSERHKVELLKREFVSIVSHELRTPLTSIRGSLGLVNGGVVGQLPDRAQELIDIAYKNSERLVRLINDILDIEKIESGKLRLDMHTTEVMPLVEQALQANLGYANQFGVTLSLIAAVPGLQCEVDIDRFGQIMANLLSNAIKFSPRGGNVEVAALVHQDRLRVEVRDHGQGMPKDFRDTVFEKFSQADATDARRRHGTGLGLAITKSLVESMRGSIGFDSDEGAGTTFWFELPALLETFKPSTLSIDAEAPRVLVCSADPDIANLLVYMLGHGGYAAEIAYAVDEAARRWASGRFGVVVFDTILAANDVGLVRHVFSSEGEAIPIVYIGVMSRCTFPEGERGNPDEWLDKPIDEKRLLATVREHMPKPAGRPRVLHVEDDADLSAVVAALVAEVADVERAGSLKEARQRLNARHYDLVVLDPGLPDGDGYDLLPLLRGRPVKIPVVVYSANDPDGEPPVGVTATLTKTGSSNDALLRAIRTYTERSA